MSRAADCLGGQRIAGIDPIGDALGAIYVRFQLLSITTGVRTGVVLADIA